MVEANSLTLTSNIYSCNLIGIPEAYAFALVYMGFCSCKFLQTLYRESQTLILVLIDDAIFFLAKIYLTQLFLHSFLFGGCPCVKLRRARHSCVKTSEFSAEKANVVWEPSKDLKHLNLRLLVMIGFEEEDKATNYIRFVMERAVGLRGIMLCGSKTCEACDAIDLESPTRYEADKACRRRIKERLTHGSSSSVKIINCDRDGNELVIINLIDEVLTGHS
jgi:hypothetical protein